MAPGTIRLRRLGRGLFVPVDADLVPALLEDEVEGLTRGRGLVFLPGGTALRFDPDRPLPTSRLLGVDRADGLPGWESPPEGPTRADRLVEVSLDLPGDDAEARLGAGGDDIATEETRPEDTGAPRRALGGAAMGAGRGMMWLGRTLGMSGLSGMGARWIGSAMELAPRLGEALLGKQEGALRDLLREFREGDVERALRRALPLGKGNERGASAAGSADLPERDPSYSLPDILGPPGVGRGGGAGYWFGGFDVQQELIREYHRAAQAAARRGDYRRAAFIYARLLEDYRLAAGVLLQGGLARDAALIYLEKLDDRPAAARAFEAAGEFDRALALYRGLDDFERAGDLLARLGEPEEALEAYLRAADRIVDLEGDHLKAGELLRSRASRPDLASRFFADGWAARPGPNAVSCAVELARSWADSGEAAPLRSLVAEADELLGPPGHEADASRFYNELARLADLPGLAPCRVELRDRALIGLAGKLRQRAGPGASAPPGLASSLFGPAREWSADLIRDAEYALRASARPRAVGEPRPASPPPRATTSRLVDGPVTAVAFARGAGLAFLGTRSGDVYRLDPARGEAERLGRYAMPVCSLAVDEAGGALSVLWHDPESGRTVLASYARRPDGSYRMTEGRAVTARSAGDRPFLAPPAPGMAGEVALWDGRSYVLLRGASLTPWGEIPRGADEDGGPPPASVLLPMGPAPSATLLELGPPRSWAWLAPDLGPVDRLAVPWSPRPPIEAAGASPSLSWIREDPGRLILAGLGDGGVLHQTTLSLRRDPIAVEGNASWSSPEAIFRAACLVRPGLLAGVGADAVHWLRAEPGRLARRSTTGIALGSTLAAVPSPKTGELVLIGADGRAERLPLPYP
ncbi:tetratricopeptide repeat protein [Tautonia plasticadhaerens]|uniref:tetratricopeptide repeat protein n=1 Tax=Tautonia plasticadhaerens TaxID=2527974 RepID=UPI0018D24937|nr:tetratricopeptide repeat protein [Tautonia plasticadhaerens]